MAKYSQCPHLTLGFHAVHLPEVGCRWMEYEPIRGAKAALKGVA